jgi:hypothetical protein
VDHEHFYYVDWATARVYPSVAAAEPLECIQCARPVYGFQHIIILWHPTRSVHAGCAPQALFLG